MNWFSRLFGERSRTNRSSRCSATPLRIEELEPRWVPSGVTSTTSTNWSGYAVTGSAASVSAVSGSWTVPTVTGTGTTYSAVWVGIDGFSSSTVEQTGIAADVVNGQAQYYAWYEMYPQGEREISSLAIHPGDKISASVTYSTATGTFTLTITDSSDPTNNTFSTTQSAPSAQRSSAEWIVEAPTVNSGQSALANFGSATFSNAQATINNTAGAIAAWESVAQAQVYSINMTNNSGTLLDNTSALDSTGGGFTVTYGSSTPTPPPPAPPAPPAPTPGATTTTLTGTVDPHTRVPTVTLTATVSGDVPVGSKVELLSGSTVLATGVVEDIGGKEEVSFVVSFYGTGTFTFTAAFLGTGTTVQSTSNTVTVTVY
jgi:hypothetical protein